VAVLVTIDNTAPVVDITAPAQGGYVTRGMQIVGSAVDPNLAQYEVAFSAGECASAFQWAPVKTAAISVTDGSLATWDALPLDGSYCLRLRATDQVGNTAEVLRQVMVDTLAPAAPVLSGHVEASGNVQLAWTQNTEPDLAGYNVYRDGQRLNQDLITENVILDANLAEGVYRYTAQAVDQAGNESKASNEMRLVVDTTAPDARIGSPAADAVVSGLVTIKGTAFSSKDFKEYRLYVGQGPSPATWTLIRTSPVPTSYDRLAWWDTLGLAEAEHSIRLEAEDLAGNINSHAVVVTVDNAGPDAPVLLSATAEGSDVAVTWEASTAADVAGYLVYRNHQVANASGIMADNLTSYLVAGTAYGDTGLADGVYRYFIVAMDKAGNLSGQSNTLEAAIDTRAPQTYIAMPEPGHAFEHTLMVKADSVDLDIQGVQFQYKRTVDSGWSDLGAAITTRPYVTYLDPGVLGLTYGEYDLRALATDHAGSTDSAPAAITITYTDLTPPDTPGEMNALVTRATVGLTWTAAATADLDGYHVYRKQGETRTRVNPALVRETSYQDLDVADGTYTYDATAVDIYGNEGAPCQGIPARVYAPLLLAPPAVTPVPVMQVQGSNATAGAAVQIFVDIGQGPVSQGQVVAGLEGNFNFEVTLSLGENRITAQAMDSEGHVSKISNPVVVVHDAPPAAPTGLAAAVDDDNVHLTWDANPEADLAWYNVYRDELKINLPFAVTVANRDNFSVLVTISCRFKMLDTAKTALKLPSAFPYFGHQIGFENAPRFLQK